MRVFLPDDRKIAAKPQHKIDEQQQQQQPRKKKLKRSGSENSISVKNELLLSQQLRNSKRNNSNTDFSSMGGGGRLMGGPTINSGSSSPTPLKSGSVVVGSTATTQNTQDSGREEMEESISNPLTNAGARGDNILGPRMFGNTNGPHTAVAAAAASPHHSTLNTARRTQHSNPEDEDDAWQNKNSKPASRYIYHLGKSNNKNDNAVLKRISAQNNSINRHTTTSSTVMQTSAAAARTPLLYGPIPGSMDDPATMSRTSQGEDDYDCENTTILSRFTHLLRKHKPPLDMVEMEGDGNCLFRAISLQVYGDATMHLEVRRHCLDFMEREADHFRDFVADEDFGEYIARKRQEGVHGNHTEIQAMSELYNRQIEVYVPNDHGPVEPINIFHSEYKSVDAPIRLCYMDGNHYNAVIDPLVPTAGLGLGLPGLKPGLADKLQLEQAKKISNDSVMDEKLRLAVEESNRVSKAKEEIELKEALCKSSDFAASAAATVESDDDVYKKKALYLSEMEAADFDLEQAVLASSLESYKKAEQERKPPSSRRSEGRRNRYNSSPRSQRSSSNSPVHRSNAATAVASSSSNQYATAAVASSVASLPGAPTTTAANRNNGASITTDEYPASVQELVMNGFELSKVLHAYDFIGDNFDDLLSYLYSTMSSAT